MLASPSPAPTFGRRRTDAAAPPPVAPAPLATAEIYARLAQDGEAPAEFSAWRRDRQLGWTLAWAASFALMAAGLVSFVVDMPLGLSIALEVTGLVGGGWLRRARRRRLASIRDWDGPAA